jgi:hypothetical protein
MNLVVLPKILQLLLGPFGILQLLLHSYSHQWSHPVDGHFSKAPFLSAMPRNNDVRVTWLG